MRKKILMGIGVFLILAGLVLGGIGLYRVLAEKNAGKVYDDLKVELNMNPLIEVPEFETEEMENPIDFESLTKQYPDIYAWIRIPDTKVDYPILQHATDNEYYLNHTYDGKKRAEGSIFTDNYNSKDFSDPNTIIYGHNMKNGSMFKGLHKYRDKKYMEEHSNLYIYQEGRILHYKIFAAYIYDDRNILSSFDFSNPEIYESYLKFVLTKKDMSSNIDTTVDVTTSDKIITMSTCNNNDKQRYLVQAVLFSIQE